jgi:hypothetical protein
LLFEIEIFYVIMWWSIIRKYRGQATYYIHVALSALAL